MQTRKQLTINEILKNNQYTLPQFKSQWVSAFLNGVMFGAVSSFYFLPLDFKQQQTRLRYRNSRVLYTASTMGRCGLGFAILRCTYGLTEANNFNWQQQFATCFVAFVATAFTIL